MKIKLLVLRCADIEISKNFYSGLGFSFNREKHGNGPDHYSSENNEFVLELYPAKNGEKDYTRIGFEIKDLKSVIGKFKVVEEYLFNSNKVRVVVDPDGRKVELYEITL